jgi:hypothetical protein
VSSVLSVVPAGRRAAMVTPVQAERRANI